MNNVKIDFIKKDKNKLIKLVTPNFIYNRFDIRFNNQYELIKISAEDSEYYVPLRVDVHTVKLGLYMVKLPQLAFDRLIEFIFLMYDNVDFIEIKHSLNSHHDLVSGNQWTIKLPDSETKYISLLGKKTRLHIKQYFKYIQRDFEVDFKTYDRDIPTEVVGTYYRFKKETLNHTYTMPEQEYLKEFYITKAHVLYLNNEIAAISFICELEDSKDVYYENFSYDKNLSKYSLGTIITYYTIKKLIEEGYSNFYMAGGNYLYKRNLSTELDNSYNGIIKRKKGKHLLKKAMFQIGQNNTFYFLRFLGLKFKKRKTKENCPLEINKNTKCLMVCPHPDDEILGAGALMIKYSENFDCLCMGSSGVATSEISAEDRSKVRIKEFNHVMDTIGIKNHWIFETYGIPRFDKQMDAHFNEYCEVLKNLKTYDYIFLPHPSDGHHEHRYITNKLFKKIVKNVGFNKKTKIVFYEVWKDMRNPNVYFDTSQNGFLFSKRGYKKYQNSYSKILGSTDETLLELKYRILSLYESQFAKTSLFIVQTTRNKCIDNGANPIWRFRVVPISKYL